MDKVTQSDLASLPGVGSRVLEHLAHIHIYTIQDLLFHLPLRYEDRTRLTPIAHVRVGDRVMVQGIILKTRVIPGRRVVLVTQIEDKTGIITLRFFHFTALQRQRLLRKGSRLCCFGEVRSTYRGGVEMIHPEYHYVEEDVLIKLNDRMTAIYPTTKGLGQNTLRKLVSQAFRCAKAQSILEELLPQSILDKMQYPSLYEALDYVHRPPPDANLSTLKEGIHPMQQRLAFDELLAHYLSWQAMRQRVHQHQAPSLKVDLQQKKKLLHSLPFALTAAQQRVISEIESDLAQSRPMLRLVQGDVGSGKTIVAAIAAVQAVAAGFQVAVMVPTEILVEQHYQNFQKWCCPLGFTVGWLSRTLSAAERRLVLKDLYSGDLAILIGTHALFQSDVQFRKLALLVIDEQHRFGVHQRLALKEKGMLPGQEPHQLIMTATPIPRTLAMTAYAHLDYSTIDELPPGRQPITTILVSNQRRHEVIERVAHNSQKRHKTYWVCTLVEESEALQCQAAEKTAAILQQQLNKLQVGLIHGRMKSHEKEHIMTQFKAGSMDLLVATTVIEVGVDVPEANLIVIENPERLGLAQLHQLRGRVGRGHAASYCVLLYQNPLSHTMQHRLEIMRKTQNGFEMAQADLEIRGPGEVLGTKQAGSMSFRIVNLIRDYHLFTPIKHIAYELQKNKQDVCQRIMKRWLGHRDHYLSI